MIINKSVADNIRDNNLIKSALEGGQRLQRRDKNIYTAFTYGKKLKYDELDDPGYISKIKNRGKFQKMMTFRKEGKAYTNESFDAMLKSHETIGTGKSSKRCDIEDVEKMAKFVGRETLIEVPENEELDNTLSSHSEKSGTSHSISVTVSKSKSGLDSISRNRQSSNSHHLGAKRTTPQAIATSISEEIRRDSISIILEEGEKSLDTRGNFTSNRKLNMESNAFLQADILSGEMEDQSGGAFPTVPSISSQGYKRMEKQDVEL